jgi:hypothetical protein
MRLEIKSFKKIAVTNEVGFEPSFIISIDINVNTKREAK